MNNPIINQKLALQLLTALWILCLLSINETCLAVDPRQHQIEIETWGQAVNGVVLGVGWDKKELEDSSKDHVTIQFTIKNETAHKRSIVELGSHKGILFFGQNEKGDRYELLGTSSIGVLSHFIDFIMPNKDVQIFLRLKKEEFKKLISLKATAEVRVDEGEIGASSPLASFPIKVSLAR